MASFALIDAFADRPYEGNPAGTLPITGEEPDDHLRRIADEIHQAETAFYRPLAGEDRYALRWFTPTAEVDLCGHATLASAHRLFSERPERTRIVFVTRSGELVCRRDEDGGIAMDFPAEPPRAAPPPPSLADLPILWSGRNRMDHLVLLADEFSVRRFSPDHAAIVAAGERGLIVTAAADPGSPFDYVCRCFYPAYGVPEDAVTGSAHCALAPFWAERLGRGTLTGRQLSRRGGTVRTEMREDRVVLRGRAVFVLRGELTMPD